MKVATLEDLDEILSMSLKFMETTGYTDFSDEPTISNLIVDIILGNPAEKIIIFQSGIGFIAGVSTPFIFGPYRLATEIAWWVEPDKRGNGVGKEFLSAFEYWAKEKAGCTMISMVGLDEKLEGFYTNEGYKLYERAYMKVL